MKRYNVCVESFLSNNSDFKECNNYYIDANNRTEALEIAKKCIANWNKESKGVIYNLYDITPRN